MQNSGWFLEDFEGVAGGLGFTIDEVLFEDRSEYQSIKVIRNSFLGNVMLIDDLVMLTEKDEFFYHDMLVHVPMTCCSNPEDVLIIGGGDGGSVREALKHPSVKKVVLCEIDQLVIDVARKFFPALSKDLDNPKVELFIGDGIKYVETHKESFDCVCIDSTDPIGPAVGLFTPEFYSNVKDCLRDGGTMSAQTESPAWSLEQVTSIRKNILKGFGNARLYVAPVPCYPSGMWSFTIACKDGIDPVTDFDRTRAEALSEHCRYYNPEIHQASFALPNFIKKAL